MKGIILLCGEPYKGKINAENSYVVACDAAYEYAVKNGINPSLVIGDFDTLGYYPEGAEIFSEDKDYSDAELAIDKMIEQGVESVEIYCGGAGRDDHALSVLCLSEKLLKNGIKSTIISNFTKAFFVIEGEWEIACNKGDTISFIPLSRFIKFKSSSGLKYSLNGLEIARDTSLGISNKAVSDEVSFDIQSGEGFCFLVTGELNK